MEQNLNKITWQAREYKEHERSADWFWGLGLIMLVSTALALWFNNFLLAIIILLGGSTIIMYARRTPELLTYEIGPEGIKAGNTFYPYANLDSFWISDKGPAPQLLLESKRTLMPLIDLPLDNVDLAKLRDQLLPLLKEEYHEESLINHLADWLGI